MFSDSPSNQAHLGLPPINNKSTNSSLPIIAQDENNAVDNDSQTPTDKLTPTQVVHLPKPQSYIARLEDRFIHNHRYVECAFELVKPHNLEFLAGQYVSIKIDDQGTRRSYSICTPPSTRHGFGLLVDVSPAGAGSSFLQHLPIGQSMEVLAPLGRFTVSQQAEEELVFVATGSGITPFKSMIEDLIQTKTETRKITLYWGMRYIQDLFWLDEIQDLVEAVDNFTFYPVLSQPAPEWSLSTGHVTDLLQVHQFSPTAGFYICGNRGMIESTQELLLAKHVPVQYIHHEPFY